MNIFILMSLTVSICPQDAACSDGRICEGNYFCCKYTDGSPDRWCCPIGSSCAADFSCSS
jgi:hypothetical protein